MFYTETNNIPGLLLILKKNQIDSLLWSFIYKTLDIFIFKAPIKNWIKTFFIMTLD